MTEKASCANCAELIDDVDEIRPGRYREEFGTILCDECYWDTKDTLRREKHEEP